MRVYVHTSCFETLDHGNYNHDLIVVVAPLLLLLIFLLIRLFLHQQLKLLFLVPILLPPLIQLLQIIVFPSVHHCSAAVSIMLIR